MAVGAGAQRRGGEAPRVPRGGCSGLWRHVAREPQMAVGAAARYCGEGASGVTRGGPYEGVKLGGNALRMLCGELG